jgi:hypothetical protein
VFNIRTACIGLSVFNYSETFPNQVLFLVHDLDFATNDKHRFASGFNR